MLDFFILWNYNNDLSNNR